jgi:hypothetical protein
VQHFLRQVAEYFLGPVEYLNQRTGDLAGPVDKLLQQFVVLLFRHPQAGVDYYLGFTTRNPGWFSSPKFGNLAEQPAIFIEDLYGILQGRIGNRDMIYFFHPPLE